MILHKLARPAGDGRVVFRVRFSQREDRSTCFRARHADCLQGGTFRNQGKRDDEFKKELEKVVDMIVPKSKTLRTMDCQKRLIQQDIEQDLEAEHGVKGHGCILEEVERGLLEA